MPPSPSHRSMFLRVLPRRLNVAPGWVDAAIGPGGGGLSGAPGLAANLCLRKILTDQSGLPGSPPFGRLGRSMNMTDAVIVDAVRTPGGRRNGKLHGWHAVDLAAEPLKALLAAQRPRPRPGRRRDHGLCHAGGRAGTQHRPKRRARRRVPRVGARHHHRPPVRVLAAGAALRRSGRDRRRLRRRYCSRGRAHDPHPHGLLGRARPRASPSAPP